MANLVGDASTVGNRTLEFNSIQVGNWVESFNSTWRRTSDIQEVQCFWANEAILDGGFPALIWEHEITIYDEEADRKTFADFFVDLGDKVNASRQSLEIVAASASYAAVDFGLCYIQPPELVEPDALLLFEAGFVTLRFIGTTKPVVT